MIKDACVAFVFARGGSKGLPRKNVRPLDGIPLIGHAVRTALATPGIERCVVSTDDAEIAETAKRYGADIPFMRPPELATDKASEWLAWRHAISTLRARGEDFETFVSVPATAPLRLPDDVAACLSAYRKGGADIVVTVTETNQNPYFNKVTLGEDGAASLAIKPAETVIGRQAAPKVYAMTTVAYVTSPDFVLNTDAMFLGRVRGVVIPPERAIDIDTELDFKFAELLMRERKG